MLVVTRKPGEAIAIDGGIRVFLLNVGHHKAKIGIDAPSDLRVLRTELVERCASCGGHRDLVHGFCDLCNQERAAK